MSNNNEQWVVVKDGKRVGKTLDSQQEALAVADKLKNSVSESSGQPSKPAVEVKQNLLG
jgi:hypothetical protein